MIMPPVTMRYAELPVRDAVAIVIPGDDAGMWFQQIAAAGLDPSAAQYLLIPEPGSLQTAAAVVIPATADFRTLSAEYIRYGRVGARLYAPVHAVFFPEIRDAEWDDLLPDLESCFVWHPHRGLIRFEAHEQLNWHQITAFPPRTEGDWSHASAGVSGTDRLHRILAAIPVLEIAMEGGKDDIGSRANAPSELPPHPDESRWKSLAAAPLVPIVAAAAWLGTKLQQVTRKTPSPQAGGQQSNSGQASSSWASSLIQKLGRNIQRAVAPVQVVTERLLNRRIQSLQRLLHQFDRNPDEALRYAIPLGGEPGRGSGVDSGWQLTPRDIDFRPGRPGAVGSAWAAPPDLFRLLSTRYREAAQREMRLGRYRRAAYIYLSLLAEPEAAAAALLQGKFFVEAAALYRDRIRDPRRAAECLEQGGLLQQAIEIYEDLKMFEQAGTLYERLDDHPSASAAYQLAVDQLLNAGNISRAADLLESKLKSPDLAIDLLKKSWPGSPSPAASFRKMLDICERANLHSRAEGLVQSLAGQPLSKQQMEAMLDVLPVLANRYSERTVQSCCVEQAQRIISGTLLNQGSLSAKALTALEQLFPADRVLERDCSHYQTQNSAVTRSSSPPPPRKGHADATARLVSVYSIPQKAKWRAATTSLNSLYLAGFHEGTLRLLEIPWDYEGLATTVFQQAAFRNPEHCCPLILTVHGPLLSLAAQVRESLGPEILAPLDPNSKNRLPDRPLTVSTPRWFRCHSDLLAATDRMGSWILNSDGLLRHCDFGGRELRSIQLPLRRPILRDRDNGPLFTHLCVTSLGPLAVINDQAFLLSQAGKLLETQLPDAARGLAPSSLGTTVRVAIFYEFGGTLLWPAHNGFSMAPLPEDLVEPHGVFLHNGRLVVWTHQSAESGDFRFFRVTSREVIDLGGCAAGIPRPWQMLRTKGPEQWGVITSDGQIHVWRLEQP